MSTEQPATPANPPRRRRNRWLAVLLGVVVLFALVVFVLPTPIARHVIESQLESLGIKHNGIDTIDIDLWNSRVQAGPIAFGAGEGQQGQIGGAGFDYRLGAAFEGRALVTTFYLRGVDLAVSRSEDGAIIVNGVNLKEIAEGAADEGNDEPDTNDNDERFQAGVESFEFSDSQLTFTDVTGGVLTLQLQRLTLERLRTWTPQEPAAFSLEASLNEMNLALDGTVLPLSDPLRVTLNSRIEDVTLERVARFVGPTGLASQQGRLDTDVHYDWSIHRDGRIEGTVDGTYHLKGLEIATPAGEQAKVAEAILKVDLQQTLAADLSAKATGKLTLDASALSMSTAMGDSATLKALAFAVEELDFSKLARERERLIEPSAAAATDQARALSIIELMLGWARDLGLNALKHYLEIDGKPQLKLSGAIIRSAARDGAPAQELTLDAATLSLGTLASEAVDSGWNASAGLNAMLRGLRVASDGGGIQAEVAELGAQSNAIKLSVASGATSLAFDLAAAIKQVNAAQGDSGSLTLGAFALKSPGLTIKQSADKREATGPVSIELDDLVAKGPDGVDAMTMRGRSVALSLSPFTFSETPLLATRFAGSVQINEIAIERAGANPLSLSVASGKTEFTDAQVAPLDLSALVEAGLNTQFTDIRVDTGSGDEKLSLSLAGISSQAQRFKASGFDGDKPAIELAGRTTLDKLAANVPMGKGHSASVNVGSLDAPLTQLELLGAVVRAAGGLDVRGIDLKTDEKPPQSASIAQLSVEDLQGDSDKGVDIKRIAISDLVASVSRPAATETKESEQKSTPFEKQIKIGEFSVSSGSRIALTDPGVKPPLKVDVLVNKLKAGPIDTDKPSTRTNLSLATTLNKKAKAGLEGWASPLADKVDFDLSLDVDKLALPILSPYAASLAGVDLESGVLKAGIKAKAKAGALSGKLDLLINDLFVVPVSDKKAKEIAASIGVPAGFAVSVLKDGDGVIKFGFPVSGTLDSPQVDYSEAINKAIGGAISSLLPTGWFAKDGNSFQMQPATFVAGTAELSKEGKDVADQMSKLIKEKASLSIRTCGRAARADLVAMRKGPAGTAAPVAAPAPAAPQQSAEQSPEQSPEQPPEQSQEQSAELPAIAEPSEAEVKDLLALAIERGAAVRQYLESKHGIGKDRLPECRTAYSIEDGKPPRAEFQF